MSIDNTCPTNSWLVMRGLIILGTLCLGVAPAAAQSAFVDGERVRLRAHFDEVLEELEAADIATLTPEQQARRAEHLVRLAAYRDRGVFPLRYGGPAGLVPEFRDVHGTRCAMAELIYLSGETQLVDDVATTANNATIAALSSDPRLVEWLHENGLTVAEAGRIQPAYIPWRATDCLCVGSTSLWRGVVTGPTIDGDPWAESESGYNEYATQVELLEPLRGSDGRATGETEAIHIWFQAGVGQPVLVAFESNGQGWAFPTDEDFEMVACAIERPMYSAEQLVTCDNPVVVGRDVALESMELGQAQCRAALDTQEDLAPCPEEGCTVGTTQGSPTPALALLAILAGAVARRRLP